MEYPPYITPRAQEIRRAEPVADRHDQAVSAVRDRRRQLADYRRAYREHHGVTLDSAQQEAEDQELAELLDLRNRANREIQGETDLGGQA